jgi:hypothetical protein
MLETIVQYFTGIEQCTTSKLQEIVAALRSDKNSPHHPNEPGVGELGEKAAASSTNPPGYDEFSHLDFSRRVQQKMEFQSERCQNVRIGPCSSWMRQVLTVKRIWALV